MSSKTYLWIEDREGKAGHMFWKTFMGVLYPEVIVEGKKNNSELVKAVKSVKDEDNKYVIVFDNSFDNLQVVMEQKLLSQYANERDNIFLLNIICFEYLLLEFDKLITWIYAPDDEFLEKRAEVITARNKLVDSINSGEMNYKDIREIIEYDIHLERHNIEQLVAKLLFDLTKNTGFEVSKGSIGNCWIESCCEWEERQKNDICGLDKRRLSIYDKMKSIYEGTSLNEQFPGLGLEVPA